MPLDIGGCGLAEATSELPASSHGLAALVNACARTCRNRSHRPGRKVWRKVARRIGCRCPCHARQAPKPVSALPRHRTPDRPARGH